MQGSEPVMPELLWSPPSDVLDHSEMGRYLKWLESERGHHFTTYPALWQWSVTDLQAFWSSVRDHFELWTGDTGPALTDTSMPGTSWFPEARLNYAERALRLKGRADDDIVIMSRSQTRDDVDLTVAELRDQVARARAGLQRLGVGPGDRVAAYLPNIPECVIGFLATASLGATWSSCPPEFGVQSVIDRLKQFEPTVLLAVDGYRYGHKDISRIAETGQIRAALPTLGVTIGVPYLDPDARLPEAVEWADLTSEREPLEFEPVPFDHPLYVLYTSGTTGLPKPIVHGHGGMLLEHAKALGLHTDLGSSDRFFWFTTTGWMMWNYLVSGLLVDSTVVLYDGDPGHPDMAALWRLAEEANLTYFGVSAPYLMRCRQDGLQPARSFDLHALRGVGSTGGPLPASGFRWVYDAVGTDIYLGSLSGGTDVCTGFVGPSPLMSVWAGEIPCRMLGAKVEAFDANGRSLIGEEGELVLTEPLPSMPVGLLDDPDGSRYQETYFSRFDGAWHHGDWVTVTDRGSCIITGRSDATLNRGGVRIGTSEFYAVVEDLPEVEDSIVVHLDDPDGGAGSLLLFVVLAEGIDYSDGLPGKISSALRARLSPRHVPDSVLPVRAVPRTLSGKKLEVPVKRILSGTPTSSAVTPGTLADPAALDELIAAARDQGLA